MNRSKISTLLLFISFLTIVGCSKNSTTTKLKVVTKKNITVDSTASQYLGTVYPLIAASPTGDYLALSNVKNPVGVVKIDYDGNFVARYGSRGRGPNELLSARFFGFDNEDHMNIYDRSLGLIKEFSSSPDSATSYQSPIKSGVNISSQLFEQCNEHWVLGVTELNEDNRTMTSSSIIGKFNDEFKLEELFGSFDPYLEGKNSVLSTTLAAVDCKDELVYTTHMKVPFIQVYDLNDMSRITRTDHIPPSFNLSENFMGMVRTIQEYQDFLINEQSTTIFLTQTDDYIILPFRNETAEFFRTRNFNDRKHFLAVFSKEDYSFVDEIPLEGAPLGSTKEGYIITLVNDNPDNFQLKLLEIQKQQDEASL